MNSIATAALKATNIPTAISTSLHLLVTAAAVFLPGGSHDRYGVSGKDQVPGRPTYLSTFEHFSNIGKCLRKNVPNLLPINFEDTIRKFSETSVRDFVHNASIQPMACGCTRLVIEGWLAEEPEIDVLKRSYDGIIAPYKILGKKKCTKSMIINLNETGEVVFNLPAIWRLLTNISLTLTSVTFNPSTLYNVQLPCNKNAPNRTSKTDIDVAGKVVLDLFVSLAEVVHPVHQATHEIIEGFRETLGRRPSHFEASVAVGSYINDKMDPKGAEERAAASASRSSSRSCKKPRYLEE